MAQSPQPASPPAQQYRGNRSAVLLKDLKKLLGKVGPGFITGAADDDPSGVATYAQTGAIFGYSQLWLVWFTSPFMIVIQQMCGRIGMVTGKGLAGVILDNYPKSVLYVTVSLLVVANTINIGADLGAMASSAQMLLGLPFLFWLVLITGSIIALEILVPYKIYSRILKYLALTLFTYVLATFVVRLDWDEVLYATLIPHIEISAAFLLNIVAILGTTISPYLFFWQASEEVEEEVADGRIPDMGARRPCVTRRGIVKMNRDTVIGMFFSQIIMFFIIVTTAATLHASGITTIQTASQAAEALRPLAGDLLLPALRSRYHRHGSPRSPGAGRCVGLCRSRDSRAERGARQETRPGSGVLRGDRPIRTGRHVPRPARDQPDHSTLLCSSAERPGRAATDGAGHQKCEQGGYHGPVRQLKEEQHIGMGDCADHGPDRCGAHNQPGDRTVMNSPEGEEVASSAGPDIILPQHLCIPGRPVVLSGRSSQTADRTEGKP